jgi:uncharacterized protein YicC (UPF0701 family)
VTHEGESHIATVVKIEKIKPAVNSGRKTDVSTIANKSAIVEIAIAEREARAEKREAIKEAMAKKIASLKTPKTKTGKPLFKNMSEALDYAANHARIDVDQCDLLGRTEYDVFESSRNSLIASDKAAYAKLSSLARAWLGSLKKRKA